MNVRKPVDYSAMYTALDSLMTAEVPQMKLYCEIGRLVSGRTEKGAAVAASEYLCRSYPSTSGFSPRNLRRMRDLYRSYESDPDALDQAATIGWTQNVVILEAGLTAQERAWYIRAAGKFGWSKLELQRQIAANAHLENALDFRDEVCYTDENCTGAECKRDGLDTSYLTQNRLPGVHYPATSGRQPWWDKPVQPAEYAPHLRRRCGRRVVPYRTLGWVTLQRERMKRDAGTQIAGP